MTTILTISRDVLIDAKRNSLFHITLLISLGLVFLCTTISILDGNFGGKIYVELGFTLLWFVHFLLALLYSTECLYGEEERKSIYFYLSRYVSRQEYLIGKYVGIVSVLATSLILSGLIFLACSTYLVGFKYQILWGLLFIFLELAVVCSVLLFLSRLFSKFLSFFIFIFIFFFTNFLEFIEVGNDSAPFVKMLYMFLPNFKYYDFIEMVVHAKQISVEYTLFLIVYSVFICLIMTSLSVMQYEQKQV
tara:strand:+ start:931 stop:1674 length:744 start_codon:yes stop_codon:yes gene_type:complete